MITDYIISEVKEGLRIAGALKVAASRDVGNECRLVEADFGEEVLMVALFETPLKDEVLFKVVPSSKIYAYLPTCSGVKFTPYGLYGLSHASRVKEAVSKKAKEVLRLSKEVWVGGFI